MLFDCRITVDTRGASKFASSIRQIFRWSFVTSYASRNALINSVLQSLGSFRKFIHSKIFLCTFPTKTKHYFSANQIVKMINFDQSKYDEIFSMFLH